MHRFRPSLVNQFRNTLLATIVSSAFWSGFVMAQDKGNEPDPILAIVGNQPIHESYVQRSIRELDLGDQIDVRSRDREFLESVIREEILFQYALGELENDPDWRDTVKGAIVQKLIENQILSGTEVSDEEAKAYYLATKPNLGGEHITLYDIRFEDRKTCDEQYSQIKTLEDFQQVASKFHVDPELAGLRGEVGFLMTRHVAFGYGPQLDGLDENTPHLIMNGIDCHIVWFTDRQDLPVPTFEELRERLKAGLKAGAEAEKLQALLAKAQSSIGITRTGDDDINSGEDGQSAAGVQPGQSFTLLNNKGEEVDQKLFTDKNLVIMFGFTHCPEVCPTTLFEMSHWQQSIGEHAGNTVFAFVSVDPERDTPSVLNTYVNHFSDTIVGLTGKPEEIAKLTSRFGVQVRRVPLDDGGYTMDHSSQAFLVNRRGEMVDTIQFMEETDSAVRKLRELVGLEVPLLSQTSQN